MMGILRLAVFFAGIFFAAAIDHKAKGPFDELLILVAALMVIVPLWIFVAARVDEVRRIRQERTNRRLRAEIRRAEYEAHAKR